MNSKNSVTPLELLNLYYSDGQSLGNRENKLWQKMNSLLSWDNILNHGYQSDLCPLLYYILAKWLPAISAKHSAVSNPTKSSNPINAINAINSINLSPDCERVCDDILIRLKDEYRWSLARNMLLFDELGRVLKAFSEANIDVIVLKGAALAQTVYPDIALRPMGDVDLLVQEESLKEAEEELSKLGYKFTPYHHSTDFCREYYLQKENLEQKLELHWGFTSCCLHIGEGINIRDFWEDAKSKKIANINLLQLGLENLILYLCWHCTKHRFIRLLWLCDIAQIMKNSSNSINWHSLIKRAIDWKSIKPLYYTLYLCMQVLGNKIPEDIYIQLKPSEVERKLFDFSISKTGWWHGRTEMSNRAFLLPLRLTIIDGIKEKIKFLKESWRLISNRSMH